jgi:hypothetical protein
MIHHASMQNLNLEYYRKMEKTYESEYSEQCKFWEL